MIMNGMTLSDLYNRCTVNDKNTHSHFGAILKDITPVAGIINYSISKHVGASHLRVSNYDPQWGSIEVSFYVSGVSEEDCSINVSRLVRECQTCVLKTSEDSFEYDCVLTGVVYENPGVDFYRLVILQFGAIKRLPLVKVSLRPEDLPTAIYNKGTVPSGMVLEVTPLSEMSSIQVCGITINNLSAGQTLIIDGLKGTVKCDGVNRFLDTDLINFPKVQPGSNLIEVSKGKCNLVVSFYPTFSI